MRNVNLHIFDPGDNFATASKDGGVVIWTVNEDGSLTNSNSLARQTLNADEGIEALNLLARAYNCLKREGINTVGELRQYYDLNGREGFTAFRNMTNDAVDNIVSAIQETQIIE